MGPRLPARVPAARRCCTSASRGVPRIALTATADAPTRARDRRAARPARRRGTSSRASTGPTSATQSSRRTSSAEQLLDVPASEHRGEAGIVYCLSRKKVEETAAWLAAQGIDAAALPRRPGRRRRARRNQDAFLREDGVVIVATIAFGMGIDKPDVRFVAHLDLPKSTRGLLPGDRPRRAATASPPRRGWRTASRT